MAQSQTLLSFIESVSGYQPLAIFGKTRHGKTTFCRALVYEALKTDDYNVVYIDTEAGAPDVEQLARDERTKRFVTYRRITTNDALIKYLNKLRSKLSEYKRSKLLLIIDSLSAPALAQFARSRRYDERGIVSLEKINAVSHVKELVDTALENGVKIVPVIVLHPVSDMTVTRQLQQVARKLAELQGSRTQRISIDQLPDDIVLQYQMPSGGKALHFIKEIWLTRQEASGSVSQLHEQRLLDDDEVNFLIQKVKSVLEESKTEVDLHCLKLSKFRIYAWGSRLYPRCEPLVDLYLIDLLGEQLITYRIVAQSRSSTTVRVRIV